MAYIEHNFFPLKVYVRNEYMYQQKKGHGEFTPGVVVSVRCMPGQAALFQVQIWNCFSYNFTVLHLSYVYDTRVEVYMKDHKFHPGSYYATINWGANDPNTDLTLAEDPLEHKSHHIILLDNGQIALQPNNRIKWSEPSFVTKPFPERPDYMVNIDYYNCEGYEKWQTEDSDRMFYDNE